MDQQNSDRRRRDQVFLVHEEALRYNPGDSELERRCADLALELGRYKDAQRHLTNLLENAQQGFAGPTGGRRGGGARGSAGPMQPWADPYDDAEKWFDKSVQHDPGRVACYDRLARLRRTELRRIEAADGTIRDMVAKNPQAGRAYIYRWRYAQEFAPPAQAGDIQKALKLAPDDPEVLLDRGRRERAETGRRHGAAYFEKGLQARSQERRASPWAWLAWRFGKDTSIGPRPSCGKRTRPIPPSTWPSSWPKP